MHVSADLTAGCDFGNHRGELVVALGKADRPAGEYRCRMRHVASLHEIEGRLVHQPLTLRK
jgi:hypothetical protein